MRYGIEDLRVVILIGAFGSILIANMAKYCETLLKFWSFFDKYNKEKHVK